MRKIDKLANKVLKQLLKHECFATDEPKNIAKRAHAISKEMYKLSDEEDNFLKPGTKIVFKSNMFSFNGNKSNTLTVKGNTGFISGHVKHNVYKVKVFGSDLEFIAKFNTDFTLSFE